MNPVLVIIQRFVGIVTLTALCIAGATDSDMSPAVAALLATVTILNLNQAYVIK